MDERLAADRLDRALPFIKREAVVALSKRYATEEGAMDSIAADLRGFYEEEGIPLAAGTIEEVQRIHKQNMFPHMNARWDDYPDNRGHFTNVGCFRCHGSDLETTEGRSISADCNLCHVIVSQGFVDALGDTLIASGMRFQHPVDIDEAWTEMNCHECHSGGDELY